MASGPVRLAVGSTKDMRFIHCDRITHLRAEGSYTIIFCVEGTKHTLSRNLGEVEEMLPTSRFFRCHHSHCINLDHVTRFIKTDGYRVELRNGATVEVARRRKSALLKAIRALP